LIQELHAIPEFNAIRHLCLAFRSFPNHLWVCIVPGSKLQSFQMPCIFWILHDKSTDVHHHASNLV
jgi:hypothetical protein